jgi:hypothetical protein
MTTALYFETSAGSGLAAFAFATSSSKRGRFAALGLPRSGSSALRIEVEVNAHFIRQSGLNLSGHVVGEHLIAASFDCTQHLPNYVYRLDLWKSELAER